MTRDRIASGGIEITDFCNLNCLHCYIENPRKPIHMQYDQIIYLIEEFIKYQARYIVISGGEPFMHPDIEKLIKEIGLRYSNVHFIITTNGSFLNNKVLDLIKKFKNIEIQISLDGATKNTHEQQHGQNTFEKICQSLEYIKDLPPNRKTIRMTVSRVNYKECVEVAKLAQHYNAEISYSYVCKVGRANQNWETLKMSLAQQMYVNETILKYARQINKNIIPPKSVLSCPFEESDYIFSATVHTNGDLDICTCLDGRYVIGNLFVHSFDYIFNSPVLKELTQKIVFRRQKLANNECKDCAANIRCWQGCIGRASYMGDEFGLDDQCDYRRALMFKNYYLLLKKKGLKEID